MKRTWILLFCFLLSLPFSLLSQKNMPSHLEIAREFFSRYSHEREEPYDRVFFAKMKNGWHVNVADITNEKVKSSQHFWDLSQQRYKPLHGFGPGLSPDEIDEKIETFMNEDDNSFLQYGFERCRYHGYNRWDIDMIEDFGNKEITEDTLLEGMGRAYDNYAERYMWSGFGGQPFDNDPLKTKLGRLEMPGKARIDQFIFNVTKATGYYKKLAQLYPGYKLKIGSTGMKYLNEQFHIYQQLMTAGYKQEANKILSNIGTDSLYYKIGRAYLDNCPPNAILITFGDNDTYSVWYVQLKHGYRKDVTVINNSLLGFVPYVDMLKRDNIVNFSTSRAFLRRGYPDYFQYQVSGPADATATSSLTDFIRDIHAYKYPDKNYWEDSISTYRVKHIQFEVDAERIKEMVNQDNIVPIMNIPLKDYMLLSDFLTLDIAQTNMYTRPVCLSALSDFIPRKFLQQEGLIYRFLPVNDVNAAIEAVKIEAYLSRNPDPIWLHFKYENENPYKEDELRSRSGLYERVITYYLTKNDPKKADEWAGKYLATVNTENVRFTLSDMKVAEALVNTSYKKKAAELIESLAISIARDFKESGSLRYLQTKEEYKIALNMLWELLEKNELSTLVVSNLLTLLE